MSVECSPYHHIPYHFVAFDAQGQERSAFHGMASASTFEAIETEKPTDVFLFSHGWNADPAAALEQYGRWIDAMAARDVDRERLRARAGGFRPLLVGVHWPSRAWADEELGSLSYTVDDAAKAVAANATSTSSEPSQAAEADPVERLAAAYATRLGDRDVVREAVRTIVRSAMDDAAPATLPAEVRAAYERIDAILNLGHAGAGAAPGDDREPFNAEEAYQAGLFIDIVDPVSFGALSLGGVLAPLRVLSFWAMKRRALAFGESGASELLDKLRTAAGFDARVHVAGHSFGCIVASAAVAGPPERAAGRPPVQTLVLVQAAMSLWSFCSEIPSRPEREGYFHRVLRDRRVEGPVIVTTSKHDRAVRVFYPLGAGVRGDVAFDEVSDLPVYGGIGTFGVRGPGIELVDDELKRVDEQYDLRPKVVYNLNADDVIATNSGISGAHSDICHPEVARAVWRAVKR